MRLKLSARDPFAAPSRDINYFATVGSLFLPKDVKAFRLHYSPHHSYSYSSGRYHPPASHEIMTLKTHWATSRWNARNEPFWWHAVGKREEAKGSTVLRSHMGRKMRSAVVASLKNKGFKPDGTRLDGNKEGELYGTAEFFPQNVVLRTSHQDLVRQTDIAVERIMDYKSKRVFTRPSSIKPVYANKHDTKLRKK